MQGLKSLADGLNSTDSMVKNKNNENILITHIMRKIIALLIFSVLLCACEPLQVRQGRKVYKAYFNHVLKDPKSLVIHSEEYTLGENQYDVMWEIDYGARNSYGGMVREHIEFTTSGNFWIKIDPLYGGESYDARKLFNN